MSNETQNEKQHVLDCLADGEWHADYEISGTVSWQLNRKKCLMSYRGRDDYPLDQKVAKGEASRVRELLRLLKRQGAVEQHARQSTGLWRITEHGATQRRAASSELTITEARELVDKIKQKATELAEAIRRLRDSKGWAVLGYESWAECCEQEFGYTKRHANRLIKSQEVIEQVGHQCPTSPPPTHAAILAKLPEDQRSDCWQDVLDECNQCGDRPTAAAVQEKVNLWVGDNEPIDNEPIDADVDQEDEFDVDARGDRLCDWLRHELDQWPQEHLGEALHWITQIITKEFHA